MLIRKNSHLFIAKIVTSFLRFTIQLLLASVSKVSIIIVYKFISQKFCLLADSFPLPSKMVNKEDFIL